MPEGLLQRLPRTVVVLGCVSFANDAASEMITPLLPVFLTAVLGAGPAVVGLIEGVAEATASVLKVVSGRLADRGLGSRRLVMAGYGVSNVARPAIGLALGWTWVLALRFADRVGKGIRTAPRDALITEATTAASRGRSFGFHRAMDHGGAVLGPLAAFWVLSTGASIAEVFAWSIVPGVLVMALIIWGLPADAAARPRPAPRISWSLLDRRLKALVGAAAVLALAAVPETLVVLWATQQGLAIAWVPLIWATASLLKMLVVMPAGYLSDRVGRMPVLVAGWTLRAAVLVALAMVPSVGSVAWLLFIAYGVTLALTEAAERSLVGDMAPAALRGTVFGVYHLATGLFTLPGAVMFGLLWEHSGAGTAFLVAAVLTASGAFGMLLVARRSGSPA